MNNNDDIKQKDNNKKRHIFISATFLSREYNDLKDKHPSILDDAILFFGSKRYWLFPSTSEEMKESKRQPTKYNKFSEEFKDYILEKEKQGLVYFLKPDKDYEKVSKFIEKIKDPVTDEFYKPLILDKIWWKEKFDGKNSKFQSRGFRVLCNFIQGDHDYSCTMELLYQSNKNLVPVLTFLK